MTVDVLLFSSDPGLLAGACGPAIAPDRRVAAVVVDWERRGKAERQTDADARIATDTQIGVDTPDDLGRVSASVPVPVICRINAPWAGTAAEVEEAVARGADEILVPMIRTVAEAEHVVRLVDGRIGVAVMVETVDSVEVAADLARLPISRAYVGLMDLALDRGTLSIFTALVDGTVERVREQMPVPFGFGGLTIPGCGAPVPTVLLLAEMARLDCSFTFLRRSFIADVAGSDVAAAIARIRAAAGRAAARTDTEVAHDRLRLIEAVAALEPPLRGGVGVTALSVVLPLYRTRAALPELVDRLRAALDAQGPVELVLVDDADPDRSYEAVPRDAAAAASIVVRHHDTNLGQIAAVITGLAAAGGDLVAVMDADLQDAPEDLPLLVERLRAANGTLDAVAAGRHGHYESRIRELTGRGYRRVIHRLTGGRIPADAGMYLVMTRATRDRVLALNDPAVHLVAALGRTRARVASVPAPRRARPAGSSGYRPWGRVKVASRAIVVCTPLYPALRRIDARRASGAVVSASTDRHNETQRRYFSGRDLPRMDPARADTAYTRRHADVLAAACAIAPGDRVLDVGCGRGKYTLALARRGISVQGMDLTPGLLSDLERADPNIVTHIGDLGDPPAEMRGAFDVVVGFFVLHHVPDPAAAFAGTCALLRPGGRAGFLEPNPLFPGYYVQITCTPRHVVEGRRRDPPHAARAPRPRRRAGRARRLRR